MIKVADNGMRIPCDKDGKALDPKHQRFLEKPEPKKATKKKAKE